MSQNRKTVDKVLAEEQPNCENPEDTQQNAEQQWEEDAEEESFECFSPDSPLSDKSLRWSSEHAEEPSKCINTMFVAGPYDAWDAWERPMEDALEACSPYSPWSENPVESEKAGDLSQPSSSQQIPSGENHGEVPGTQKKRPYSELSATTHEVRVFRLPCTQYDSAPSAANREVPGQSDSASSAENSEVPGAARWQSDSAPLAENREALVVHSAPSAENHEDPGKICCLSEITMRIGTAVITMKTQTVLEPDHPTTVPQQGSPPIMATTSWTRQPPRNEEHRRLMIDLMRQQRQHARVFTLLARQRFACQRDFVSFHPDGRP